MTRNERAGAEQPEFRNLSHGAGRVGSGSPQQPKMSLMRGSRDDDFVLTLYPNAEAMTFFELPPGLEPPAPAPLSSSASLSRFW
jgi:hypothetical protein